MPEEKDQISFPLFVLGADLYKSYSSIQQPLDSNFVSSDVLCRGVEELDVPSRITATSAREVFKAYKADRISFAMVA
jgi:hypothetical protein